MASPTPEIFFVFNASTGNPLTGGAGAMSFSVYQDDTGGALSQPSISEVGGGYYKFTPAFPSNHGIAYLINTAANPKYVGRYMRPEDYYTDGIPSIQTTTTFLQNFHTGKWSIPTTGPNANTFIIYEPDGVTILAQYNLLDKNGNPTFSNPLTRTPV